MDAGASKAQRANVIGERIVVAVFLCITIVLFGLSWPVVKIAVSSTGIPPLLLVCSRSGFAFFGLLVVALVRCRFPIPTCNDIPALFGVGVLQLTAFFLLCHIAIVSVPASHTAILSNATDTWVVPLSVLIGRSERMENGLPYYFPWVALRQL